MVIVLSIQSKVGTKVNIIFDRLNDLWNGYSEDEVEDTKKKVRVRQPVQRHAPSQADNLDNTGMQNGVFPTRNYSARAGLQNIGNILRILVETLKLFLRKPKLRTVNACFVHPPQKRPC